MAGGTWVAQNKVRPGLYINFVSEGSLVALGERGTVSLPLTLPWGPSKQIVRINAGDDVFKVLGYDLTAPALLLVKEALKRAATLLVYRLNTGTKAAVTVAPLTATARYGGTRGNNLTVTVQVNVDDSSKFDVITKLSGVEVDRQVVATIAALVANDWIVWSGEGAPAVTAGAPLVGGADGVVTNGDYTDYLSALELQDFQAFALPSTDATLKSLAVAFTKRLRDDEGKKVTAVLENYPTANFEGVISVKNGVILADGTTLTAAQATAWVAAATAAAEVNEGLTNTAYDDAVDVSPRYTNSQIIAAIKAGEFVFKPGTGSALVEVDINTLTAFTPTKGKVFSKNRVVRVLDAIANDLKVVFESFYLGKVANNGDGRTLLKNEFVKYLEILQGLGAIQNLDPQTDITIVQGADSDAVYVEASIQPVDAVEKIYTKVRVI